MLKEKEEESIKFADASEEKDDIYDSGHLERLLQISF